MFNFIRGIHRFEIIGISPERFINIANRRRLHIFNLHCVGERVFGCIASAKFFTLSDAAEKAGVQLIITDSYGLPFIIKKYRKRMGFVLGFGVFCFMLWYLSLFVWDVEFINLPEQYSVSTSDAVYESGIRVGVMSSSIDGPLLERELERKLSDFYFIKISRLGCHAQIYFYPAQSTKSTVKHGAPCDVIAASAGEIVSVIAKAGTPMVAEGDVVYPGDILISGLFEGQTGYIEMVHSYGEVQAITECTFSETVDYRQTVTEPTGRIITINRLMFFGMEIPLFYSAPEGNYSRTFEEMQAEIFGFKLPLKLRREYWQELCYVEKTLSQEDCLAQAEKILDEKVANKDFIEIISSDQTVNEIKGGIRVTRYVTFLEDIAEQRKILFN